MPAYGSISRLAQATAVATKAQVEAKGAGKELLGSLFPWGNDLEELVGGENKKDDLAQQTGTRGAIQVAEPHWPDGNDGGDRDMVPVRLRR